MSNEDGAIMELCNLFPPGNDGRLPIIAVTGSRARDAGRRLAALLTDAGYRVGRASRDGVFLAGRKINLESATAYDKARTVLRSGVVDVAVLEADARDLLRKELGCDRCEAVLLTGQTEADDSDDIAALSALDPDGKIVLNADDPPLWALTQLRSPSADRLIWFAQSGDNVRLCSHRAAGGTAVFLYADSLVVVRGVEEQRLPFGGRPVQKEPGEQLALLAALAGAMALNLCGDEKPTIPSPRNARREATLASV